MTVISAILSKQGIAVGSDSFITYKKLGVLRELLIKNESKIITVNKFSLILSYWGFAGTEKNPLMTKNTLKKCADHVGNYTSLINFLEYVKTEVEQLIKPYPNMGIGIHATAIEKWKGFSIPEMFLISNYADTNYRNLKHLELSRRTWFDFGNPTQVIEKLEGEIDKRLHFKNLFDAGQMFTFNNGDPLMFNPFAMTYFHAMLNIINFRSHLKSNIDLNTIAAIATLPIEAVVRTQQTFYKKSERIVGGKIHSAVIEPNGTVRIVK